MPTYDYECTACGHEYEKFQSITAKPARTCPICRGRVRRLIGSGAGIIFRGSGFYQTDYRSKEYQTKAKAETGGEKSDSSKSESTADSKSKSTDSKSSGKSDD